MKTVKTMIGGTVLALGLGLASFAPQPAHAQNSLVDLARVIVNVNDIVYRGGQPYYRYGNYGPQDRIIVVREGGRDRYYRNVPRGNAYGYYGHPAHSNKYKNKHGKKYKNTRYYSRDSWDRDDRRWDRDDDRRYDGRGRGR